MSKVFIDENDINIFNSNNKLPDESIVSFKKVTFDPNIETFRYKPCPKPNLNLGPPVRNENVLNATSTKCLGQKSPSAKELLKNRNNFELLTSDPRRILNSAFDEETCTAATSIEMDKSIVNSTFQRIPVQAVYHTTDSSKTAIRLPSSGSTSLLAQQTGRNEPSALQRLPGAESLLSRVQQMSKQRTAPPAALAQASSYKKPSVERVTVMPPPPPPLQPVKAAILSIPMAMDTKSESSIKNLRGNVCILEKQQVEMRKIMQNLSHTSTEHVLPITTTELFNTDPNDDVKLELCSKVSKLEQIVAEREDEIRDITLQSYSRASGLELEMSKQAEEIRELKQKLGESIDEKSKQTAEIRRISKLLVQYERKQPQASNSDEFWQKSIASMREVGRLEQEVSDLRVKYDRAQSNQEEGKKRELELLDSVSRLQSDSLKNMETISNLRRDCDSNREYAMKFEVVKREQIAGNVQLISLRNEIDCLRQSQRQEIVSVIREKDLQISKLREMAFRSNRQQSAEEPTTVTISVEKMQAVSAEEKDSAMASTSEIPITRAETPQEDNVQLLLDTIADKDSVISQLEEQVKAAEAMRRSLHDKIQELRGNIRVYVRSRPFISEDGESEVQSAIRMNKHTDTVSIMDGRQSQRYLGDKAPVECAWNDYTFDRVFDESSAQSDVFFEVKDFVLSAMDGHRVSLFSYGQTGSGKTHTMIGTGKYEMKGIIPRAIELMLEEANRLRNQGWTFQLTSTFLEIYNEQINDLLGNYAGPGIVDVAEEVDVKVGQKRKIAGSQELSIKIHPSGSGVYVPGLVEVVLPMSTIYEQDDMQAESVVDLLLKTAQQARSTAHTDMNDQSSRSHSVFTLSITGSNADSKAKMSGSLNLVDLAGSERVYRSGAVNDAQRLKEASNINKSLSCLADIFTALKNKASHIPFRNSKLTYLLQDCFVGCGKALMFINLSPTILSVPETVSSLTFAKLISQIELGKAVRNVSQGYSGCIEGEASLEDFRSQDAAIPKKATMSSTTTATTRSQTQSKSSSAKVALNDLNARKRTRQL